MKILLVGCGSIGKRHIKNLSRQKDIEIAAYRVKGREPDFEKQYRIKVYRNYNKALREKPDAVFITNPTSLHIKTALKAAKSGANLFIEKPISHSMNGVGKLENIVRKKKLKVFVAYNMRFLSNLKKAKELIKKGKIGRLLYLNAVAGSYLPNWRPGQDYTKNYSAKKRLGGGVILDLSHEIDYVRWLAGDVMEVNAVAGKLSNLKIETEDSADIGLKFRNGSSGSIHLDYIQKKPQRHCEIIGTKGMIKIDFIKGILKFVDKNGKVMILKEPRNAMEKTYISEIKHFIKVLQGKERLLITLEDGKKVLEIALAAKKSAKNRKIVKLK